MTEGINFLKVKVIEIKGQLYVFVLFPSISQVLGSILTKLGENMECDIGFEFRKSILKKVKVIEVKGQIYIFLRSLVRFC